MFFGKFRKNKVFRQCEFPYVPVRHISEKILFHNVHTSMAFRRNELESVSSDGTTA